VLDIDENLTVTLTAPQEQLSPAEAFRAAEALIRAATRHYPGRGRPGGRA